MSFEQPKILIVENDPILRTSLIALLSGDYEVFHAECETHVLALLSTGGTFDLALISDDETGREVAKMFERREPQIPVIFMADRAPAPRRSKTPCSHGFIKKPVHKYHGLLELIQRFLAESNTEEAELAAA